jgi:hypothetical protein
MRILRIAASSALLAFLLAPGSRAGGLRIALLASTEVQSDTILLANLLPTSVSRRIRTSAEQISLGIAPQDGSARLFTRNTLTAAIAAGGLSPSDFTIPAAVTVRRGGRLITRGEVLAAIQSAQAQNLVSEFPSLQLKDLAFDASVRVPRGDPGLQVTQISFDPLLERARIRLWPRNAPGVLAFYVTAGVSSGFSQPPAVREGAAVRSRSQNPNPISAPVQVATGHLARLHLHSQDMEMLLEVRPLQPGRLGDVIRVSLPGTGRTFQARVVGKGDLDANL